MVSSWSTTILRTCQYTLRWYLRTSWLNARLRLAGSWNLRRISWSSKRRGRGVSGEQSDGWTQAEPASLTQATNNESVKKKQNN